MRRAAGSGAIALAFAVALGLARAAIGADFAVPPVPHAYVTDAAGALDGDTKSGLEDKLRAFEQKTQHQVIVYVADTTGGVPLETWTAETAHEWKIGRKGKDDGAILFLFMKDRRVRIEVGYGLEGSLTDADASRIINDDIVPHLREGAPDDAVTAGVDGMLAVIDPSFATEEPAQEPQAPNTASSTIDNALDLAPFIVPALFFALFLGALLVRRKTGQTIGSSGSSGSSGFLSSDDDDSSSSSGDDFDAGGGDFGGGGASGSW